MDNNRTLQRINTILKHIETVESDLKGLSLEDFEKSDLLTRATCFSITQIGEQMIKIEDALKEKYPDMPWKYARNMRNLIVHVYNKVKAEVIYVTATEDMQNLKESLLKIRNDLSIN